MESRRKWRSYGVKSTKNQFSKPTNPSAVFAGISEDLGIALYIKRDDLTDPGMAETSCESWNIIYMMQHPKGPLY